MTPKSSPPVRTQQPFDTVPSQRELTSIADVRAAGFSDAEIKALREKRYIGVKIDQETGNREIYLNRDYLPDVEITTEATAVRQQVQSRETAKQVRAVTNALTVAPKQDAPKEFLETKLQSLSDKIGANVLQTYLAANSEIPEGRAAPSSSGAAQPNTNINTGTANAIGESKNDVASLLSEVSENPEKYSPDKKSPLL